MFVLSYKIGNVENLQKGCKGKILLGIFKE